MQEVFGEIGDAPARIDRSNFLAGGLASANLLLQIDHAPQMGLNGVRVEGWKCPFIDIPK